VVLAAALYLALFITSRIGLLGLAVFEILNAGYNTGWFSI